MTVLLTSWWWEGLSGNVNIVCEVGESRDHLWWQISQFKLPESTTVAGTVGTVILQLCMHHVQAALLTSAPLQQ